MIESANVPSSVMQLPIFMRGMTVYNVDEIALKEGVNYHYDDVLQISEWHDIPFEIYGTCTQQRTSGNDTKVSGNPDWEVTDHLWIEPEPVWTPQNDPAPF